MVSHSKKGLWMRTGTEAGLRSNWSGRRDSNPRPPAWKAGTLPLSYSRTLDLHVNFTLKSMTNQAVEYLLIENLVTTDNLESLIKGYLLNCRTENLSPKTIAGYQAFLRNFTWHCKQNNFPRPQKLTAVHIKHFLRYLMSDTHRWNSTRPNANRAMSSITVNDYFRALRTFFN